MRGVGPRPSRPRGVGSDFRLPSAIRIVHEDGDLLVVDKPSGLLTAIEPDSPPRDNLFDFLKRYIRATRGWPKRRKPGEEPQPRAMGQGCFIIHRLDKETSGLLVFATSPRAFEWLKNDFKAKRVHRLYTVLCDGKLGEPGSAGTIQSFLKEDEKGLARSIDDSEFRGAGPGTIGGLGKETAKLAVTHYRVIASTDTHTLAQVRLDTGRKNQIRAHLAERGHPLAGDARYGAKTDPVNRLALHASELGFTHPATGQTVRFVSPAPAGFYRAVGAEPPEKVAATEPPNQPIPDTAWENVAGWYDKLHSEGLSDHYTRVIIPGTVRLVQPRAGMAVLDVACGQGVISRALAGLGAQVVGVDGAPSLISAAEAKGVGAVSGEGGTSGSVAYRVGDARALDVADLRSLSPGGEGYDAAACVMALTNIEPIEPVCRAVADLLKPGGRLVVVISHPAFRIPGQTAWGWDPKAKRQYRRVEGYLSAGQQAIDMHPGQTAAGGESVRTITFHRPLQHYVKHLGEAGLLLEAMEEWPAERVSQPGPKAAEENRIRKEIPLFLALRCVKR
jgi:RluA family pseudouridine synthase